MENNVFVLREKTLDSRINSEWMWGECRTFAKAYLRELGIKGLKCGGVSFLGEEVSFVFNKKRCEGVSWRVTMELGEKTIEVEEITNF